MKSPCKILHTIERRSISFRGTRKKHSLHVCVLSVVESDLPNNLKLYTVLISNEYISSVFMYIHHFTVK